MRFLQKPAVPPAAIREYLAAQTPVGHGLDYETFSSTAAPASLGGGSRGGQLCRELTEQQHGLCAYTGVAIDDRAGRLENEGQALKFIPHNEHLKPQSICREELRAQGKEPGVDLGEDMDHRNIVAALLVSGAGSGRVSRHELFGAAKRTNQALPVFPTNPDCETKFLFDENGGIHSADLNDESSIDTINILGLDHYTLETWHRDAIIGFVDDLADLDLHVLAGKLRNPNQGPLPEFCFALLQIIDARLTPSS